MNPIKTLIFVPTFNERDNAPRMCREIHALNLDADVLFVDDNSPDGTGELLEAMKTDHPRLIVNHRKGKLGIGSAHFDALDWAYEQGYELVVSLDCDFTHSPGDIPAMIAATENHDIAVGSRWLQQNSLPGWNIFRRLMTNLGHWLTCNVLGVPQDASGAFRAYRLDRLPREVFHLVKSRGYSFFFESLFIMNRNGFSIVEVPIVLPARTYGHSKMSTQAAL
ncbi:MAG: glycosyltransferase, partial [Verrucomicrobiota bacterium]